MIVTEVTAKTKWCSFASASVDSNLLAGNHAANRNADGSVAGKHKCLGSACMAWVWHTAPYDGDSNRLGYCGRTREGE